jgi:hypothetical protein
VKFVWRGEYGRIGGGREVLELAADSREASSGKGGRCLSISMLMAHLSS